jgi:integrase
MRELSLDYVPYELRHTFASLLIHAGMAAPLVAAQMGHSRSSMTLDHYAHFFRARDLRAGVPVEDAVHEARSQAPATRWASVPALRRAAPP